MPFLRQSTSQVILFGPCLDKTDGVTEETGLTLAQGDMRLSKDGGAFAQKSAAGNATHDSDGWYNTTLSTTDTATVGELVLNVHQPANMLPVWLRYWVIEEAIYDALFGASATGFDANKRVDVGAWLGGTIPVQNITGVPEVDVTHFVGEVAPAPAVTGVPDVNMTYHVDVAASVTNSELDVNVGQIIGTAPSLDTGDLEVHVVGMDADTITASALATDAGDEIADQVWDEAVAGHVSAGTFGKTDADILVDTAVIGALGAGLTDLGGMSTGMKAEVQAEVVDALKEMGLVLSSSTIETVTNQTNFIIPATADAVDDDAYNDLTAVFIDGTDPNQVSVRSVINYTASTRSIQVDSAPDFTVTTSDTIALLSSSNARAIWNRIITGANHNETNSAGRILRQIQERGGYSGGFIYIDTVNGTAGTTDFENGTDSNAVKSIADANTLAASLKLSKFDVAPGSSITFAAAQENHTFVGRNWTLALGGQSISNSHFTGADVSGTGASTTEAHFDHCEMGDCTLGTCHIDESDLEGNLTLSAAANYFILDCHHTSATVPNIDFGGAVANTTVHIHNYHGAIQISNMGQNGTDTLHFSSADAKITLNSNNIAGGTANLNGVFDLVDNAPNITVNKKGLVNQDTINAEVDTAFTTQMADSVPADGTISTREQALYAILQLLTEFTISSTTMTVKKVDGSTTLMTLTLDDATNPTSLTRAT